MTSADQWTTQADLIMAFSFLGFVLATLPLAWQLEAWNVGCSLYGFWSGLACLIQFINHYAWRHTARNIAPVWCEIALRFIFMARLGVVSAGLVIARRVSIIATGQAGVCQTRRDKIRMMVGDLALGLTFPIGQLVIYWFVQGHRFDIFEGLGCSLAVPNTILATLLSYAWPLLIGLASAYYSIRTLHAFYLRRKVFREVLSQNSNLTINRYFRLLFMAVLEMACTVPLSAAINYLNIAKTPIYPYKGLTDLHQGFGRIRQYPLEIWLAFPGLAQSFEIVEWLFVGCALVFFLIFGLTEEARRHYISECTAVAKFLHVMPSTKDPQELHCSMNSFMTKLRRLCGASNPEKPHTTLSLSFASAETTFESEPSDSDSSDEKEDSLSAHASQISVNSVHSDDPESQREHHSLDLTNPQFVIDITPQVSAV